MEEIFKIGDKVRVKEDCHREDFPAGTEFTINHIKYEPWGTFVCPDKYRQFSISAVSIIDKEVLHEP